jgi:hypothetical protein
LHTSHGYLFSQLAFSKSVSSAQISQVFAEMQLGWLATCTAVVNDADARKWFMV